MATIADVARVRFMQSNIQLSNVHSLQSKNETELQITKNINTIWSTVDSNYDNLPIDAEFIPDQEGIVGAGERYQFPRNTSLDAKLTILSSVYADIIEQMKQESVEFVDNPDTFSDELRTKIILAREYRTSVIPSFTANFDAFKQLLSTRSRLEADEQAAVDEQAQASAAVNHADVTAVGDADTSKPAKRGSADTNRAPKKRRNAGTPQEDPSQAQTVPINVIAGRKKKSLWGDEAATADIVSVLGDAAHIEITSALEEMSLPKTVVDDTKFVTLLRSVYAILGDTISLQKTVNYVKVPPFPVTSVRGDANTIPLKTLREWILDSGTDIPDFVETVFSPHVLYGGTLLHREYAVHLVLNVSDDTPLTRKLPVNDLVASELVQFMDAYIRYTRGILSSDDLQALVDEISTGATERATAPEYDYADSFFTDCVTAPFASSMKVAEEYSCTRMREAVAQAHTNGLPYAFMLPIAWVLAFNAKETSDTSFVLFRINFPANIDEIVARDRQQFGVSDGSSSPYYLVEVSPVVYLLDIMLQFVRQDQECLLHNEWIVHSIYTYFKRPTDKTTQRVDVKNTLMDMLRYQPLYVFLSQFRNSTFDGLSSVETLFYGAKGNMFEDKQFQLLFDISTKAAQVYTQIDNQVITRVRNRITAQKKSLAMQAKRKATATERNEQLWLATFPALTKIDELDYINTQFLRIYSDGDSYDVYNLKSAIPTRQTTDSILYKVEQPSQYSFWPTTRGARFTHFELVPLTHIPSVQTPRFPEGYVHLHTEFGGKNVYHFWEPDFQGVLWTYKSFTYDGEGNQEFQNAELDAYLARARKGLDDAKSETDDEDDDAIDQIPIPPSPPAPITPELERAWMFAHARVVHIPLGNGVELTFWDPVIPSTIGRHRSYLKGIGDVPMNTIMPDFDDVVPISFPVPQGWHYMWVPVEPSTFLKLQTKEFRKNITPEMKRKLTAEVNLIEGYRFWALEKRSATVIAWYQDVDDIRINVPEKTYSLTQDFLCENNFMKFSRQLGYHNATETEIVDIVETAGTYDQSKLRADIREFAKLEYKLFTGKDARDEEDVVFELSDMPMEIDDESMSGTVADIMRQEQEPFTAVYDDSDLFSVDNERLVPNDWLYPVVIPDNPSKCWTQMISYDGGQVFVVLRETEAMERMYPEDDDDDDDEHAPQDESGSDIKWEELAPTEMKALADRTKYYVAPSEFERMTLQYNNPEAFRNAVTQITDVGILGSLKSQEYQRLSGGSNVKLHSHTSDGHPVFTVEVSLAEHSALTMPDFALTKQEKGLRAFQVPTGDFYWYKPVTVAGTSENDFKHFTIQERTPQPTGYDVWFRWLHTYTPKDQNSPVKVSGKYDPKLEQDHNLVSSYWIDHAAIYDTSSDSLQDMSEFTLYRDNMVFAMAPNILDQWDMWPRSLWKRYQTYLVDRNVLDEKVTDEMYTLVGNMRKSSL